MKLNSITICNMHQIPADKPLLQGFMNATYLIGPNGAGKSTILQAVQLALLGYIPGYDKTNAGIIKHSNDGKSLEVTAELVDDDITYLITRKWYKSGNSVKSEVKCSPADFDIKSVIGNIELPVFNFNEFKDMTSNKLKEWFINFLPKDQFDIDWREYLTSELGSRSALLSDDLMDLVLDNISELEEQGKKGVDLVAALNDQLKLQQSFNKSTLDRLQGTINSLIYYQDAENLDKENVEKELSRLQSLRDELLAYQHQQETIQRLQRELDDLHLPARTADEDPEITAAYEKAYAKEAELGSFKEEYNKLQQAYNLLATQFISMQNIASNICPYSRERCEQIAAIAEQRNAEKAAVQKKMDAMTPSLKEASEKLKLLEPEVHSLFWRATELESKYERASGIENAFPATVYECPTDKSVAAIDAEINALHSQLVRIEANEKFKELNDTVTKDKYKCENNIEVLKIWINSTGANGLQTYMMEKPFETLAGDLSIYLTEMYGHEVIGKFRLEEKANSFSFGMLHSGTNSFVEFDLLSSGEKCLFTAALIMCLIDKADSKLKLMLADDIFDHLDNDNAERFFAGLSSKNIQCIMAGVKECSNSTICVRIGGEKK